MNRSVMRTRAIAVAAVTLRAPYLIRLFAAVVLIAAMAIDARAQAVATFGDLPLRLDLGDKVTVIDADGAHVRGRVLALTPDQIVVDVAAKGVTLTSDRVSQVGRCCDSIKNGALIGGLTWGTLGFLAGLTFADRVEVGDGLAMGAVFFGLGAGLGAGIDALIPRDVIVYRARPVKVGVGADVRRRALMVTIGF